MLKFQALLEAVDIFGHPIQFSFKNNFLYKSFIGGILTLIVVAFSILIFIIFAQELFDRKTPNFIYNEKQKFYPDAFILNENSFPLVTGIENYDTWLPIRNEKIYTVNFTQYLRTSYKDDQTGQTIFKNVYIPIDSEPCDLSKHIKNGNQKDYFQLPNFNEYYCINFNSLQESIKLEQYYDTEYQASLYIDYYVCQNNTQKQDCAPQEEIDSILLKTYYNIYHTEITTDPSDYAEPFQYYKKNQYGLASNKYHKTLKIDFKQVQIQSDVGLVLNDYEYINSVKLQNTEENYEISVDGNFFHCEIQLSPQFDQFTRIYKKIQKTIAEVGGIISVLIGLITVLLLPMLRLNFYQAILNEIFVFENVKKKDFQEIIAETQMTAESLNNNKLINQQEKQIGINNDFSGNKQRESYQSQQPKQNLQSQASDTDKQIMITEHECLSPLTSNLSEIYQNSKQPQIKQVMANQQTQLKQLNALLKNKINYDKVHKISQQYQRKKKYNKSNILTETQINNYCNTDQHSDCSHSNKQEKQRQSTQIFIKSDKIKKKTKIIQQQKIDIEQQDKNKDQQNNNQYKSESESSNESNPNNNPNEKNSSQLYNENIKNEGNYEQNQNQLKVDGNFICQTRNQKKLQVVRPSILNELFPKSKLKKTNPSAGDLQFKAKMMQLRKKFWNNFNKKKGGFQLKVLDYFIQVLPFGCKKRRNQLDDAMHKVIVRFDSTYLMNKLLELDKLKSLLLNKDQIKLFNMLSRPIIDLNQNQQESENDFDDQDEDNIQENDQNTELIEMENNEYRRISKKTIDKAFQSYEAYKKIKNQEHLSLLDKNLINTMDIKVKILFEEMFVEENKIYEDYLEKKQQQLLLSQQEQEEDIKQKTLIFFNSAKQNQ